MRSRALLPAIVWLCLAFALAAQALTFPALSGRVVDEAGLLSATDRAALTEALAALEAKTTDQLVVVTLKSLQGTTIEDYGYQLGRNWQIGQRGKNNGALLIVAPNERSVRIEVGYGLEGTLTDAATKVVIEATILPRFKAGDFPGGIRRGTAEIIRLLTGDDPAQLQPGPGASAEIAGPEADFPVGPAIAIALAAVALLIFCAATGGALCGFILRMLFWMLLSGRGGSSSGNSSSSSSWSGGGGSFGGGGSSGRW